MPGVEKRKSHPCFRLSLGSHIPTVYLDSQVAGNNRPLYPKVDTYWFKVAQNYEPLALQVVVFHPFLIGTWGPKEVRYTAQQHVPGEVSACCTPSGKCKTCEFRGIQRPRSTVEIKD